MNHHAVVVIPFRKMLVNVDRWLDAAVAFAEKKKFDADT